SALKNTEENEKVLDQLDKRVVALGKIRGEDELAYIESQKRLSVLDEELKKAKIKEEFENKVSKNLGISGLLMQKFSEKLGLGSSIYGEMTKKSRELEESQLNGDKISGFSKKWQVLKAGGKEAMSVIGNLIKSPSGILLVGTAIYKVVEMALDAVGNLMRNV
ncbi:MAG: hypothetical protein ACKO96_43000, partial [Flammeovirgaceae bacterium]